MFISVTGMCDGVKQPHFWLVVTLTMHLVKVKISLVNSLCTRLPPLYIMRSSRLLTRFTMLWKGLRNCCLFLSKSVVMSWGRTEGVPRFYIFGEDLASAYVLRHQTSTVLEFQARDRRGFRGSDGESEGQSMSISDWRAYMRIRTYKYQREHSRVMWIGHMSGSGFGLGDRK